MPHRLPIYELEEQIVARVRSHPRLIIQAPTGSGKSTQIPQMLLRHGLLESRQVVILQPRRLAARLLASRVAAELGVRLGQEVGYQVRFESVAGPQTRIKFVTEGILLRQMVADPDLRGVSVLIFDEFHERHLYGDITLAQALQLQESRRPDLRIIVMSATLQPGLLEEYLSRWQAGPQPSGFALAQTQPQQSVCAVLQSEGRVYPVEVEYLPWRASRAAAPVWEQAAEAFARYVQAGGSGDVLVFMPGAYEIGQTLEALRRRPESRGYLLLPLHGELPPRDQDAAVARYDQPKIVVSTNVAETSVTIDGIRLVIDSGLARIPRYDPQRGLNTLFIEKISRASADQRAGRAGRTAPGRCMRLWTQEDHAARPEHELPEIKRLDLAEVVLTLKAAGVTNLRQFRWLEPPSDEALAHAERLLLDLGALQPAPERTPNPARPPQTTGTQAQQQLAQAGATMPQPTAAAAHRAAPPTLSLPVAPSGTVITELGRRMLAFPVHPRYARMLLAAQQQGCVYQACLVAALTQGRDLLQRNPGRAVEEARAELLGDRAASDFLVLMRAWNYAVQHGFDLEACRRLGIQPTVARQVGPLLEQFLAIAAAQGLDVTARAVADAALQKCILIGFSDRVARRLDTGTLRCELVHGRHGLLARDSVVHHSPFVVAAEIREVQGPDHTVQTLLSLVTAIEPAWLEEFFGSDLQSQRRVYYDAVARRVFAEEQTVFRGLVIASRRIESPPADEAAQLLAQEILAGRLQLPKWDHAVEQWILRLNCLARWCPELGLPPITEADRQHLIESICHGAVSFKDLKDREVKPLVTAWLSSAQQQLLDEHAPERVRLPNGRTPKLTYQADGPPYIAVRIQELYDVETVPRVAMGRVPVVVQILAPNMRPVQITQDLASFWRQHYPRIKAELQRKYPKHQWR